MPFCLARYRPVKRSEAKLILSSPANLGRLVTSLSSSHCRSLFKRRLCSQPFSPHNSAATLGSFPASSESSALRPHPICRPARSAGLSAAGRDSFSQWPASISGRPYLWTNGSAKSSVPIVGDDWKPRQDPGTNGGRWCWSAALPGVQPRSFPEGSTSSAYLQPQSDSRFRALPLSRFPSHRSLSILATSTRPYPYAYGPSPPPTAIPRPPSRAPIEASFFHSLAGNPNPNPTLAPRAIPSRISQTWEPAEPAEEEEEEEEEEDVSHAKRPPPGGPTSPQSRHPPTRSSLGPTGAGATAAGQPLHGRAIPGATAGRGLAVVDSGYVTAPPRAPSSYTQPVIEAINALPAPATTDVEDLQAQMVEVLLAWDGRLDVYKVGSILCHIPDPRLALLFHRWACNQEGYRPSAVVYTILIGLLGRAREVRLLRGLMKEVTTSGLRPSTNFFNRAMRAFAENGESADALRVFAEMEKAGCVPDTHTFRTLVLLYRDVGDFRAAMEAFEKMKERGLSPSSRTYSILIDLCAKVRRPEVAEELLREMVEKGLQPNIVTYNTLMKAHIVSGEIDRALGIFWQLEEVGCKADVITYLLLLSGLRKAWRHEDAMQVIQHLEEREIQVSAQLYTTVMVLFGEQGDVGMAEHMFAEMEKHGHRRDGHAYSAMMSVYGRVGWVEEALQLLDEMVQDGLKPDNLTFGVLVDMLRHAGRFHEAERLVEEMRQVAGGGGGGPGGRADEGVLYTVQVQSLLDAERYHEVEAVIKRMRDEQVAAPLKLYASLLAGYTRCPDQRALAVLVKSMGLAGHWVHDMVVLLQKKGVEEDALWEAVCAQYLDRLQGTGVREGAHRFIDVLLAFLDLLGLQARAVRLWEEAKARRLLHPALTLPNLDSGSWELNVAHYEPGSAAVIVQAELLRLQELATEGESFPDQAEIIVGLGAGSALSHDGPRDKVVRMLEDIRSPFLVKPENRGRLQAKGPVLRYWLRRGQVAKLLAPRNRFWS